MIVEYARCEKPLSTKIATHVKVRELDSKGKLKTKEYYYCTPCINSSNPLK